MITISSRWVDAETLRVWACEWFREGRYPRVLFEYDLSVPSAPRSAHEAAGLVARHVADVLDREPFYGS